MTPLTGQEMNAICCNGLYAPTFGGGHDLHISGNANNNQESYINLGHSYHLPPGQNNTFFTGARNFTVTNYEVFGV